MVQHSIERLFALMISGILAVAALGLAGEPAHHWQINANGVKGSLDLSIGTDGQISGTLSGQPVTGRLVGRRLVLFREGSEEPETWEAWLASPQNTSGDDHLMLAGTFTRSGHEGPLPWFGTAGTQTSEIAQPVPALAIPAVIPLKQPANTPIQTSSEPPAVPPTQPVPALEPRPSSGNQGLAGTWETPDGPLTIRQDGSRLTFELPDREVTGRMTGPESLIGGFGPGCCKEHLEQAFNVIAWDNGVRWVRK